MDYYTVPEWFYVLSLFSIAAVVLSMLNLIHDLIKARIEKKKEEKEFFAPVECEDEDELIRMQALFPGKYPAKELLMIESACEDMLDGALAAETEYANEIYERAKIGLTEERENRIFERLTEARGVEGFISFMRDHGINAYLTYLQNGEIFFEDKLERADGGKVE